MDSRRRVVQRQRSECSQWATGRRGYTGGTREYEAKLQGNRRQTRDKQQSEGQDHMRAAEGALQVQAAWSDVRARDALRSIVTAAFDNRGAPNKDLALISLVEKFNQIDDENDRRVGYTPDSSW